jgi:hypothetical protein
MLIIRPTVALLQCTQLRNAKWQFPLTKFNWVVGLRDKLRYSSARLCRGKYGEHAPGRQCIKRRLEQFQLTKGDGRPSTDSDQLASVIHSPADDTKSTERSLPTGLCPATLGPYSERASNYNFSKRNWRDGEFLGFLAPPI